ncbi:MAG TPA: Stp1/IreP family PP2C-type Ser/Thr phosphatase [Chloroflexota bacterium]|nr:Stp1/IreP family PP2C-type Ser/Thr phosphatase [Chloroflexota bacterium]
MPDQPLPSTNSTLNNDLDIGSASDVGRVREANEDAWLTLEPDGARSGQMLVAVADGMGGHQAGEVASALAIESLTDAINTVESTASAEDLLMHAIELANRTIWEAAANDPAKEGMGTTMVCALVGADGQVSIANVGDSRAYTFSDGRAALVTSDHTWVNQQVLSGQMTEKEARTSPFRNLLTRSLGNAPRVDMDLFALALGVGDALVLVSDGVTGYLDEGDVASVLRHTATAQEAAERLVTEAVNRGGADNATAVVVRRRL